MKKLSLSFVAVAVCLSIYSQHSAANNQLNSINYTSTNQCYINVPVFNKPLVKGDINTLPIEILSNTFEVSLPNKAIYRGDVLVTQGNRTVNSEQITIIESDNQNRNIILNGNILYQDNLVKMQGDEASMNLNTNDIKIQNSQYHLVGRLGRGSADTVEFTNNRYIILNNGSFTSCPIDSNSWNIEGSKIIHDNDEQLLEVWDAVFRIGKVPVLYSPYLQLPTGNKRRSGLLMPEFNYNSTNGIGFSLPIYWNIAPNYDATFTPRIIQRRGVQLQTEMRYLNELGLGTIAFDWMQQDDLYDDKKNTNIADYRDNDHRWLFHWKNDELINYNWRFFVDTTRVSDNQYLNDLGSKYVSETAGYLTQHYQVGYTDQNWDIDLSYKYFQSFRSELKDDLYQTEPQLNINYYNHDIDRFNFRTFAQASHFVSAGQSNPKTWRFHVEPTLDYTLMSSWASVTTEAGFMATHYYQDIPNSNNNAFLEKTVNRFIPKLSIDGKMIFERNIDSLEGYTQTLEPRVKYIYIPYRNQSNTLNYDSSLLQSDYIGLFRAQSYSGLDRIASSNKIATGISTRFYDENKIEKFNLSLGQIYYFSHSRTGDYNSSLDQNEETGSVTWATDAFWRFSDDIIFRSGMQYDTRINKIALADGIFEYRASDNKMLQLSYRYANKNYIDGIGLLNNSLYKQDISQLGMMYSLPLTDNISAVGSFFYDAKIRQTVDSFVGLHYADCCWGVTVQYGRKIINWNNDSKQSEYENKFSVNFELRGLGNNTNAVAKMLDFGLLPYKTAFEE